MDPGSRAAQRHHGADQQRRLRDPADGTGPHRRGPGGRARLADARPVRPDPDFTQISTGLGVPATRVTTAAELDQALRLAYAEPGPHLIEAIVPR